MKKQLICICMAALLSLSLLTGCGAGTDTGDTAGTEAKNVKCFYCDSVFL